MIRKSRPPVYHAPRSGQPLWPFSVNHDSVQAQGLRRWYVMSARPGGSKVFDISNANEVTPDASPNTGEAMVWTTGREGEWGLNLASNGFNAGRSIEDTALGAGYTWAAWIEATSAPGTAANEFLFRGAQTTPTYSFLWSHTSAGFKQSAAQRNLGGTTQVAQIVSTLSAATKYLICGSWDGVSNLKVYLNGRLEATNTGVTTIAVPVGSLIFSLSGDRFPGVLYEFRTYQRVFTDAEIYEMYDPRTRYELYGRARGRSFIALVGPTTQTLSAAGELTTAGALTILALRKRLYFDSAAVGAAAPTFDAGWSSTTGALRRRLNHVKQGSTITSGSIINFSGTAGTKALDRQYISAPLNGAQAISGTVKMQLGVREEDSRNNVDQLWLAIKVVSNDGGTVRGTLLAHGNYGPTGEFEWHLGPGPAGFPPLYRNKKGADGDALTLVNAQDGDRIVVEIGYSNSGAGTSPGARALFGDSDSDLPEDETTQPIEVDGPAGWIEFSTSISFRDATLLSLDGGLTLAGGLVKQVELPLAGTLGPVGSLSAVRAQRISASGGLTPAGSAIVLQVTLLSSLSHTLGLSGALSNAFGRGVTAGGSLTPAGKLIRQPGRIFSGATTFAGNLIKQAGKSVGGELIPEGATTVLHLLNVVAAGTLTLAGALANTPGKMMSGTLSVAGNLIKQAGKYLTGVLTFLGLLRKGVGEAPCAYTLAELRQRVYERLDDDGTYYTAAEVNRSLNAAQNIFALLTLCIEREASFTTVAATCYHTVVDQLADYIVPLRVTTAAGARIHPATIHQLDGSSSTWQATSGTPTKYAAAGYDLIAFTPQYAAPTAITIIYAASPLQLVGDEDICEIPPEQQIHLVDFAMWWLRLKEGGEELQTAAQYLQRFVEAADKYSRFVRDRSYGQRYDTVPFDLASFDRGRLVVELPRVARTAT